MNKSVKSTAILMALVLMLSVFTSLAATTAATAATTPMAEAATNALATNTPAATTATPSVIGATATTATITASSLNPAVGSSITLTVTVKAGTTILKSKQVTVTHTYPGSTTPGTDGMFDTGSTGTKTFSSGTYGSAGQRVYTAKFAGDGTYAASTGTVTVNVGTTKTATTTTITASNTNPAVGSSITLTVTVKAGTTILKSKQVTVTHTYPGSTTPGTDGMFDTGSTGTKTFSSGTYGSAGQRVYTAKFAGDGTYAASTGTVTVTVKTGSTPTALRIEAQTQTPQPNQGNYMTVRLWSGTYAVGLQTVNLYAQKAGSVPTFLGAVTTKAADGAEEMDVRLPAGDYTVYATFAGSANFAPSRSNLMNVQVSAMVPVKKPTTLYVYTGAPYQKTTVNTPFVLNGALETGGTLLWGKPLTILYLYKPPSGSWGTLKTLATINSGNGFYSYLWKAPAKGEYVFRVGYLGNSGFYASDSNDLHVIVS